MKTGQVFVSHTADMARFPADRSFAQAALDAVARAGMTPVDMRYFAARDGAPAEYCRARVRECEIFVAVVGFRYGSVVPGEEVSYTELEFGAATEAGMPRLVFFLEEAASLPDGQADADRGPVEGFRQRLRDAGLVVRAFASDASLELEVFHALTELAGGPSAVRGMLPGSVPHFAGGPDDLVVPDALALRGAGAGAVGAQAGPMAAAGGMARAGMSALAVYWARRRWPARSGNTSMRLPGIFAR